MPKRPLPAAKQSCHASISYGRYERIAEVSQLFPMVFHSPATNTHRCHGKFQHLIQTEFHSAYKQNGNQRYRPISFFQHTLESCIDSSHPLHQFRPEPLR